MESLLANLKPQKKPQLIKLVENAGIDISDWANFERDEKGAGVYFKGYTKLLIVAISLMISSLLPGLVAEE